MQKENPSKIYVLGVGGMAREALQILEDLGLGDNVAGFAVEKKYFDPAKALVLGKKVFVIDDVKPGDNVKLVVAIGTPLRKNWILRLKSLGFEFLTVVHPSVTVDKNVSIGEGSILCKGVILTNEINIGNFVILNAKSSVHHNCVIGDYVTVAPGVTIGGNVEIGSGSWIGIGATIIEKISIGNNVFLGAGAVVTKNIEDNYLAYGVPAKPVRMLAENDWHDLI